MFHFSYPDFLLLGLALPPLVWWWLRQRRGALRFPGADTLSDLPPGRSKWAFWTGVVLRSLCLACLIVAAAGPRWPDLKTRLRTEGIAILMVVDVSGSMAAKDFQGSEGELSRLDAVKTVFRQFVLGDKERGGILEGRPTDLIGLVVFATRPDTACPLTLSHSALLKSLDEQKPRSLPDESQTNISDAIALGLHRLKSAGPRRRVMILLSDGEHNLPHTSSKWTPRQAAQVAAGQGIAIYAIDAGGLGVAMPEPGVKQDSVEVRQAGIRTLQEVAQISGGSYFRAEKTDELLTVYQEIDRKERAEIESFQYRRYYEGFVYFAAAALAFLALARVLELTVWLRVP